MTDRVLFLTGHLAHDRLERVLAGTGDLPFAWTVRDIGVKVAALMTEAIITRRLEKPLAADRVVVPGRCRVDLKRLSDAFGVPFERGPDELKDLPRWCGRRGRPPDLSRHDMRIFAEIVDATAMTVADIVARATELRAQGADVIDIGCRPDTPFPHLEDTVRTLSATGFTVSVDSASVDELQRGAAAGAHYLLSLTEDTLDVVTGTAAVPVLIPSSPGDLDSLLRAAAAAARRGLRVILDPIVDPIHFGFTASLERYAQLRRALPDAEIMMGTGNLTELTDADSAGVTATLLGICSELTIGNLLVVHVSPHTRRTVQEHDAARRLMFAARVDGGLPKRYSDALMSLHDRAPYPNTPAEIAETAAEVKDPNFRIEVAADGIHVYNRDGHHVGADAMSLYQRLGVADDGAHAFYLGTELMKAEIAFRLGKRYAQDAPLDWGCAADLPRADLCAPQPAGPTRTAPASGDTEGS